MSYNQIVPNASQSPGLFPPQAQANWTRLKTMINADHVFNNSAQSTDGLHKQSTYIARAQPNIMPPGANGIAYVWLDANNEAQLRYYNGIGDYQLTPPPAEFPIRVVGSQAINANASIVIYADPGFEYMGTCFAMYQTGGEPVYVYNSIVKSNAASVRALSSSGNSTINRPDSYPTLFYGGTPNLQVRNLANATKTITWSLIINKIT